MSPATAGAVAATGDAAFVKVPMATLHAPATGSPGHAMAARVARLSSQRVARRQFALR